MGLPITILLYAAINYISLYTVNAMWKTILTPKDPFHILKKILIYTIYLVIGTSTFFISGGAVINMIIFALATLFTSSPYNAKMKHRVIITVFYTISGVIVDFVVGFSHSLIVNQTIDIVTSDNESKIIGAVISKIIFLLVVKVFQAYYNNKQTQEKTTIVNSIYVLVIPLLSIVIMFCIEQIAILNVKDIQGFVLTSIMMLAGVNLFFYYLFDKLKEGEKTKYENDLLKVQSQYYLRQQSSLNQNYDDMKMIKHDLKNQMIFIKTKLNENSELAIRELHVKLDEMIGSIGSNQIHQYSKNHMINMILNYKLKEFVQKGITLDVKITITQKTKFNDSHLYIILGNALDNAIENYNCDQAIQKSVVIRIFDDHNNLYIKISNPYKGKLVYDKKFPRTSKTNSKYHGIGLKSIENLVENNHGLMRIGSQNNIFTIEVMLFDCP